MAWKMDGDKIAVDDSGNPIWIRESGTKKGEEIGYDPAVARSARNTLSLTVEKQRRKLAAFGDHTPEAIQQLSDDLEAAKKAAKKQPGGGNDEKVAELEEQITNLSKRIEAEEGLRKKAQAQAHDALFEREFGRSKFFSAQGGNLPLTTLPVSVAVTNLRDHFKPNKAGDALVAIDGDGAALLNEEGKQPASIDEAVELVGGSMPWWKDVQRPSGARGSDLDEPGGKLKGLPGGEGKVDAETAGELSFNDYKKAREAGRVG